MNALTADLPASLPSQLCHCLVDPILAGRRNAVWLEAARAAQQVLQVMRSLFLNTMHTRSALRYGFTQ
jgi:hypothetical protein